MIRARTARRPDVRASMRQAAAGLGYEVIPLKGAEKLVVKHVPVTVPLTVTASPSKGQDVTVDLAVALAGHGYSVAPHLTAQQVRDQAHLAEVVARCQEARIASVFVVGGDRTSTPTEFTDALALLRALHDLDHGFTDVGIAGHPEGHPSVSDDVLFAALMDKAPFASHITTQMVFDPERILTWTRELHIRGINLPVRVGVPGAVHRQKLLRVSAGLGIGQSAKFLTRQQSLLWRFFAPGGYSPNKIMAGLAPHIGAPDNGIAGFHVFTFNDLASTEEWRRQHLQELG